MIPSINFGDVGAKHQKSAWNASKFGFRARIFVFRSGPGAPVPSKSKGLLNC